MLHLNIRNLFDRLMYIIFPWYKIVKKSIRNLKHLIIKKKCILYILSLLLCSTNSTEYKRDISTILKRTNVILFRVEHKI